MPFDILQKEKHRTGNRDSTATQYILNKALQFIENELLKKSGNKAV